MKRLPIRLPLRPLLTAAVAIAVSGCAGGRDETAAPPRDRVVSVAEAVDATGEVAVEGYLLLMMVPEEPPRLCRGLSDSFPPACVEPSLEIEGLSGELPQLEGTSDGTHLWSSAPLVVRGTSNGAGGLRLADAPWAPAR